jgi:hypothetical protein
LPSVLTGASLAMAGCLKPRSNALTPAVDLDDPSSVTTYDRLDWHYQSAIAAGQPPENAFTHIGLYLAWVIRHDLHNPKVFSASHVAAVKSDEMTGSDLSDDIDTKFTHHHLNAGGRAFSDARYAAYLAEYETVFADQPDYSVTDDPANYALIAPLIDRMYAAWVAEGRPKRPPEDLTAPTMPDLPARLDLSPDMSREQIEAVIIAAQREGVVMSPPTPEQMPHAAPHLEALLPRDITSPPLDVSSVLASDWGSSLVNRALKRLDVRPRDAVVVTGMGGSGEHTLTVMLYGIRGVVADRLVAEFGSAIYLPPRGKWSTREFAGRTVNWATGPEFTVAFWAQDGLVVHVAGRAEDVERAVPLLP